MLKAFIALAFVPLTITGSFGATLSCDGAVRGPPGEPSSALNVTLDLGPPAWINLGSGQQRASLVSNNKIQYKFATKNFTGEYFHYTGDLFLIYKSGHLARLTCSPR